MSGHLMVICVRCGRAGCPECLPARRIHWLKKAAGYILKEVDSGVYVYDEPTDAKIDTITKRIDRAGGLYCIIKTETKNVVFATVEMPQSRKITDFVECLDIIEKEVVNISPDANRPIIASHSLKPDEGPKKNANWELVGSSPVSGGFRIAAACRAARGVKPAGKGQAAGEKVMTTTRFKFDMSLPECERERMLQWLAIGRVPPKEGLPTGYDIMNSGMQMPPGAVHEISPLDYEALDLAANNLDS